MAVLNRKDYSDDIITNINNALHFVKQELRVKYVMTGEARRKEFYEIPLVVMREAIVNASAHRDYFLYGSHTTIEIFDDRLEISNPGGLPKGLSEKEFGTKAVHRNQIIAALLQRVNLVENMGTGINKIKKILKDSGNRDAKFKFKDFFAVVFHRDKTPQTKNGGVNQVFELIETNPNIKVKDIRRQLKFSTRTIERHLKILKEKGLIEFKGSPKLGGYFFKSPYKSP
ncbi:MAG: HTH domain-containing protein [Armatimonadetes bacterium]|nr:HTH domain-containing protein [Armatimonadota bacterium]